LVAGLVDLDVNGLRLQWRNHLGGAPPAHLPRWLLLRVLGYRIQAAALGGLDKETLRVIRQPKGQTVDSPVSRPFEARIPTTREGATLKAGALLTREWNGKLETEVFIALPNNPLIRLEEAAAIRVEAQARPPGRPGRSNGSRWREQANEDGKPPGRLRTGRRHSA